MSSLAIRAVLLVGLIFLNPLIFATVEAWADGIYDAESDDVGQAIAQSTDASVEGLPTPLTGPVLIVISAVAVLDESLPHAGALPASDARAPPPRSFARPV